MGGSADQISFILLNLIFASKYDELKYSDAADESNIYLVR